MFIAIEGPNGVGKTTTVSGLAKALTARDLEVVVTAEPTNTELGKLLRFAGEEIVGPALALGVAADRISHLDHEIRPALARGAIVITDRYVPSSLVLQRIDNLPTDWIWSINRFAVPPDLVIYLQHDVETLAERIARRAQQSRMEAIGGPELETRYYEEAFAFLEKQGWTQTQIDCTGRSDEYILGAALDLIDIYSIKE